MAEESTSSFNAAEIKKEVVDSVIVLVAFLKNPVEGMKNLPEWSWPKMIFLAGALSATCGILHGLMTGVFLAIFGGLILFPISSLLMDAVIAGLFYYIFLFFYRRELSYKLIFEHLVFASIPAVIASTVSFLIPPINLVGVAFTGLLLIVGFVENFNLPRKQITKLMAGLFLIYVLIWIGSAISFDRQKDSFKKDYLPKEAEEILKEEFGYSPDFFPHSHNA